MRLKKIKLAGFKSFVDPTSIPFPEDMTAIVGPNGCGKSNVIDAVRWVLGESSAKNLRGDAMTDVIFNGSSARKPVSQCSVELVFDNSSGRIQGEYANYNELAVKRVVTRDGQSLYYLNASKCRRRDVTDLFLGTGLGPRSYAIIEQGMISRLIESKPQELRVFIEEAAGISKYKERRRETENRIRHTRENLERLNDVRGELAQQLEKLQRQAHAAKRYKELKAKERQLKGELAAIRWLKHSNKIAQLELQIAVQENQIEEVIAHQRGEESGMLHYQEREQDLKQQLSDVQNQYFQVGNQITRLEQSQIHAKKRQQQLADELSRLSVQMEELSLNLTQDEELLAQANAQLDEVAPELEIRLEQAYQAEEALTQAEQDWQSQSQAWQARERQYLDAQQQLKSRQSQVQSQQTLIAREAQRISELRRELNDLSDAQLEPQQTALSERARDAKTALQNGQTKLQALQADYERQAQHIKALQAQQFEAKGQLQHSQARLASLQSLQQGDVEQSQALEDYLGSLPESPEIAWHSLVAEPGWEKALETALGHWLNAPLVAVGQISAIEGSRWLLKDKFSPKKPADSLAAKVKNEKVPGWLCDIQVLEKDSELAMRQANLLPHQSLITQSGHWYGPDWQLLGPSQGQTGVLERAKQIQELEETCREQQQLTVSLQQQLQSAEEEHQQLAIALEQERSATLTLERQLMAVEQELSVLRQQSQAMQVQRQRLSAQIETQVQQLDEDQLQLAALMEECESLQESLENEQDPLTEIHAQREQLSQQLNHKRNQVQQLKDKRHQLELNVQGLKAQVQNLSQNLQRQRRDKEAMATRQAQLQAEQQESTSPLNDQGDELQQLLEQRLIIEEQQADLAAKLSEVDDWLRAAQKGQQGTQSKIQKMRDEQQSLQLECEGYRVRANGVLEQLEESGQSLKPLLEQLRQMAQEPDEDSWQQELDKTVAAVGRLGAVNLAAVEEYDIQAQRKQHLDEQHEDLSGALETLEGAIRKIDKETKTRFKDTFERVNDDLKMLFPKVFGGGSAYLELTDDDLLETGVSIMARPPGKKNSTIHLLSGGEKALTALSLVFAIFRLNPAPFCLLDEVDAPLDDANVGRFCKLVSEMSRTVQFIYITHNKIAMEMATHLTGVTMAEPGVSRMVAVDVDEAVALAEL
ncbi:chromosome segregation protein SMC [Aliiglaciecola sp. CAU 1673]|uniref:chromosome segregation protein SMC n=1 Tax=Aliiglaciecola sp. CAU 1673 TaxID=3032595 RepID=UPI0023DAB53D|nr:chromosome segregation protein SMC [Aliiglaciecola sp. CAU 1673]MDF2177231.1 chromosome segregation protein SMC [Aliiglaciecola sp. CAU 1673]